MTFDLLLKKSATSTTKNRSVKYFYRKYLMMKLKIISVTDDPHVLCCDVAGTKTCDQRNCCGMGWRQNWTKRCKNLVVIILKWFFFCFRRWMSLQKHWSISGIQSWKYMVSRRLVGRECWRRCQESGWARIRQSTMSLGERCLTEKNIWRKIISVFVLQYPVGWCLMIILLMTTLVSSKLEAVSKE